jgi:hypothetical protein
MVGQVSKAQEMIILLCDKMNLLLNSKHKGIILTRMLLKKLDLKTHKEIHLIPHPINKREGGASAVLAAEEIILRATVVLHRLGLLVILML